MLSNREGHFLVSFEQDTENFGNWHLDFFLLFNFFVEELFIFFIEFFSLFDVFVGGLFGFFALVEHG